jgi:hypothetical protein
VSDTVPSKAKLSYVEALYKVVSEDDMEAIVGLVENHKNWGAFTARLPSHIVANLVDEVKRLREEAGGYKQIPDLTKV